MRPEERAGGDDPRRAGGGVRTGGRTGRRERARARRVGENGGSRAERGGRLRLGESPQGRRQHEARARARVRPAARRAQARFPRMDLRRRSGAGAMKSSLPTVARFRPNTSARFVSDAPTGLQRRRARGRVGDTLARCPTRRTALRTRTRRYARLPSRTMTSGLRLVNRGRYHRLAWARTRWTPWRLWRRRSARPPPPPCPRTRTWRISTCA